MATIISDDKQIKSIIQKNIDLLIENDGYIHPDLEIICKGGNISICSKIAPELKDQILFAPTKALPRKNDFSFILINNEIHIDKIKDGTPTSQINAMSAMIELFNATKKIESHSKNLFLKQIRKNEEAFKYLVATMDKKDTIELEINDELDNFFSTRAIKIEKLNNSPKGKIFMPVIEWINHHHAAHNYDIISDKSKFSGISISHSKPVAESPECFVMYGMHDPLYTLTMMSFVDTSTPYALSIPLSIRLPQEKTLHIYKSWNPADITSVPEAHRLRGYFPTLKWQGNLILCSHLFIPPQNHPRSLRRIIEFILVKASPLEASKTAIAQQVQHIEKIIIGSNLHYYKELYALLENGPASESSKMGMKTCLTCINIIEKYKAFTSNLPFTFLSHYKKT